MTIIIHTKREAFIIDSDCVSMFDLRTHKKDMLFTFKGRLQVAVSKGRTTFISTSLSGKSFVAVVRN